MIDSDDFTELQVMSKDFQLKLLKGELKWEDEIIQFFLPVILYFTDWEWLEIIAENILIEEDEKIVKAFLEKAKTITETNSDNLNKAVQAKIERLMRDL